MRRNDDELGEWFQQILIRRVPGTANILCWAPKLLGFLSRTQDFGAHLFFYRVLQSKTPWEI